MKKTILLILFTFYISAIFAQDFSVPQDWKFDTVDELKAYQPQIEKAIDWAIKTPIDKDAEKRKSVNAFVLAWLTKTPDVSVQLDENAIVFFKTNPELLMPFIMGWTKYSLENNSKDLFMGFKTGVETAVTFYRKNISFLKKDKGIEKYEKLINKGKLDEELKKKIK